MIRHSFNTGDDRVYWYRYEDRRYAPPVNEYGDAIGVVCVAVSLYKIPVFKFTPKGVWLGFNSRERFVLLGDRKRYACPTQQEALESFFARKEKQIQIYKARIRDAEEALLQVRGEHLGLSVLL